MASPSSPPPKRRRRLLKWTLAFFTLLIATWVTLNNLLPVIDPMLVVRKISLPGARVRAIARLREGPAATGPDAWRLPRGHHVQTPWMIEVREQGGERFILPVQWSLRSFLRTGTPMEQRVVLEAASNCTAELCREEFLLLLPNQHPTVRALVARCLGCIGDEPALLELEELWTDPDPIVRTGVLHALQTLARENGPDLRDRALTIIRRARTDDPDPNVREEAAEHLLLLLCYSRENRPAFNYDEELKTLLKDSHEEVRLGIAETMATAAWHSSLDPKWIAEAQHLFTTDPADPVRANAALALMLTLTNEPDIAAPRTFLEKHCPPNLLPLTGEKLRESLRRHLPHGLAFHYLQRDWQNQKP